MADTPPSPPPAAVHAPPAPVRTGLSLLVPLLAIVCLLLLLVGVLGGAARWLVASEPGTLWLLKQLPMVQVKNFHGALLGDQWRADSLRVEWDGGRQWLLIENLAADKLRWQWRPHAYAWVALQADKVSARKLTVHLGAPSNQPLQLPAELKAPVQLDLSAISLDELLLEGQQPLRKLTLQGLVFDPRPGAQHQLSAFGFEGFSLAVGGGLRIANAMPYALNANATLRPLLEPEAPRWAAVVKAGGTLSDLDLNATLRGRPLPGHEAPQADVHAGVRPLAAWPLTMLDARTEALDLSALAAGAPSTRLAGHATLTGGADKQPLAARLDLTNSQPGRWNEGRLPLATLALELRGQLDHPDLVELSRFDAGLADAQRPAGRVSGTAVWKGNDVALEMQLAGVTPQRLDSRAAAMTLSGPIAASITGVPSLVAQKDAPPPPAIEWTLDLKGQLDKAPQPVRLVVEGSANDHELQLKRARADSGAASAELTASVTRAGRSDWRVVTQGQVRDFDPLPWWPGDAASGWRKGPHRFSGDWQFDGRLPGDADRLPPLTLAQRLAGNGKLRLHDSQLAGVPLSADITLGYTPVAGGSPATLRADFNLGGNLLAIEGRADPAGNGDADRWQLEAKADSLASLAPLFRLQAAAAEWAPRQGSLTALVTAAGRWPAMRSEGNIKVSQLQAGPLTMARGSSSWHMASIRDQDQSLQMEGAGLVWGQRHADNLRAEIRGTLADHHIEVSGAMPVQPPLAVEQMLGLQGQTGTRALLVAQGGWTTDAASVGAGRYRAKVERLLIGSWDGSSGTAPPASGWAEARDLQAELQFADKRLVSLQADAGRLRVGDGLGLRWDEVRVDLRGAQPQIQLRADIEPFALAPLLARAQPGMRWGGDLRLAAHIDIRAAERMDADVVFERRDGDLNVTSAEGTQLMGLTEMRLAVTAHDGLWNFTPVLRGRILGEISGRVKVQSTPERRWPHAEAPIEGSVQLDVADIGIWSAWVPAGWRLAGEVRGTAAVSGTFGAPLYNGSLAASGLAIRNLLQGVNFSDGQVAVKLNGETAQIERFTLKGGDGTATITGGATFGSSPQAHFKLAAEHFRLLGRVDRLVSTTGAAEIDLLSDHGSVKGRFTLDEATVDASRSDAPSLDEDVAVHRPGDVEPQSGDAGAAKPRYPFTVAVDVDLGSKARFKGWGLDTGLKGQLSVRADSGRPRVVGTIDATDGKFTGYGQKLEIDRGKVEFSGALGNPYLDVRAIRPNTDVRVGVTIVGPLQALRVRLFSDPDMSENDKLAWLMLGRAPDSLGRNETALLQRAAVALLSGEGEAPTDALMKALGIDDVSLRQGDTDVRETVVSIGKQLTRRWYVGYERGVNATTGTWQLIYRIAQRFTLRMQSGTENAMDVIWTWRFQETPANASMRKSTLTPP